MYTYPNNSFYSRNMQNTTMNNQDRSLGFFGPFLLGGITGGLVAPYFNQSYNRPNYYCCPPYYYYPPYYR